MQESYEGKKDGKTQPLSPQDKKKFCDLAKFIARSLAQVHDFGPSHPISQQSITQALNTLTGLLQEKGNIPLYVAEKKLRYGEDILEEKNPVVDRLIQMFISIKLVSVEFENGFGKDDLINLLILLAQKPQDIAAGGGIEEMIKQKNIGHLKINPVRYALVGESEKVVSGQTAEITDNELKELERIIAEGEKKLQEDEESQESSDEKILGLIEPTLKETATQSDFSNKLISEPVEEASSIIEAVRLANKVGGEKAKGILFSINKKLGSVRDDLYHFFAQNKDEEETASQTYKSASILGKELGKQIKAVQVKSELAEALQQMNNILNMIIDQAEAQKLLSSFLKGEKTLKKKVALLKGVAQRIKQSADFEFLLKKMLLLRNMPEAQVNELFESKGAMLEELEKQKTERLHEDLSSMLQKLSEKQIDINETAEKINELVQNQAKLINRKLQQENVKLNSLAKIYGESFADIEQGVILLDEHGRVIYINATAQQLTGFKATDTMDPKLLEKLQDYQNGDISSFFQNSGTFPGNEKFIKSLSSLKNIRKDESGRIISLIFKAVT